MVVQSMPLCEVVRCTERDLLQLPSTIKDLCQTAFVGVYSPTPHKDMKALAWDVGLLISPQVVRQSLTSYTYAFTCSRGLTGEDEHGYKLPSCVTVKT